MRRRRVRLRRAVSRSTSSINSINSTSSINSTNMVAVWVSRRSRVGQGQRPFRPNGQGLGTVSAVSGLGEGHSPSGLPCLQVEERPDQQGGEELSAVEYLGERRPLVAVGYLEGSLPRVAVGTLGRVPQLEVELGLMPRRRPHRPRGLVPVPVLEEDGLAPRLSAAMSGMAASSRRGPRPARWLFHRRLSSGTWPSFCMQRLRRSSVT